MYTISENQILSRKDWFIDLFCNCAFSLGEPNEMWVYQSSYDNYLRKYIMDIPISKFVFGMFFVAFIAIFKRGGAVGRSTVLAADY